MSHPITGHADDPSGFSFLRPAVSPRTVDTLSALPELDQPLEPFVPERRPLEEPSVESVEPAWDAGPVSEEPLAGDAELPTLEQFAPWEEEDATDSGGWAGALQEAPSPAEPSVPAVADEEDQTGHGLPDFLLDVTDETTQNDAPWLERDAQDAGSEDAPTPWLEDAPAEPEPAPVSSELTAAAEPWAPASDTIDDAVEEPQVTLPAEQAPIGVAAQAERGGEPAPVLEEVAARLERIAHSLREHSPAELLGTGANDPLQMLIAGYALGLSEASRAASARRDAPGADR